MRSRQVCWIVVLLAVAAACSDRDATPTGVRDVAPLLAKPVGPSDPSAIFKFPLADAGLGLKGDGLFSDGTYSLYSKGVCGVNAKIFATTQYSNSGDAIMQTDNPSFTDRKCSAYPRKLSIDYGDGVVQQSTVFMNVQSIQNTTTSIPIGTTMRRPLNVNESRCAPLRFREYKIDGTYLGADQVNVTRLDARTWLVESQPYPANKAECAATGQKFNISVSFVIVSSFPLP